MEGHRSPSKRQRTLQYGVHGYAKIDKPLRDDRAEVASIATPHLSHAALALAMENGLTHSEVVQSHV